MKTLKTILAIALSLAMISALCACSIKVGGEETWEYSADTKEGCEQLFNDFFRKTFENTNQVVTVKGNGSLVSTETIDGTSDCITYSTKAESDELFLLAHRVRSKGHNLRTQKFCHLLMGVAIFILGKG